MKIEKYFNNSLKHDSGINIAIIDQAKQFLYYLNSMGKIKLPHINYNNIDKEINFYWFESNKFVLDLGFKGDGKYSYYCRLENGNEYIEDSIEIKIYLHQEIMEYLKL